MGRTLTPHTLGADRSSLMPVARINCVVIGSTRARLCCKIEA